MGFKLFKWEVCHALEQRRINPLNLFIINNTNQFEILQRKEQNH